MNRQLMAFTVIITAFYMTIERLYYIIVIFPSLYYKVN